MTISERINKKFNSHGTTIEESIKNAKVSGGGYSVETKEVTVIDLTVQKDNWTYNSKFDISTLSLPNVTFDDTMETLNVTLDGETKTFFRATNPAGNTYWVYPETFETDPDMSIGYNSDVSAYSLDVYNREVSYDSVKISTKQETVTVEDDFKKAVEVAGGGSSSGGVMVVNSTLNSSGSHVLDKTWQEINNFEGLVIIQQTDEGKKTMVATLVKYEKDTNIYTVYVDHDTTVAKAYSCSSPDAYPMKGIN